jgi:hypothetical protein
MKIPIKLLLNIFLVTFFLISNNIYSQNGTKNNTKEDTYLNLVSEIPIGTIFKFKKNLTINARENRIDLSDDDVNAEVRFYFPRSEHQRFIEKGKEFVVTKIGFRKTQMIGKVDYIYFYINDSIYFRTYRYNLQGQELFVDEIATSYIDVIFPKKEKF